MPPIDIAAELERYRRRLLDLTLRNPLLSLPSRRATTLTVIDELPAQIYEHLVEKGRGFTFRAAPSAAAQPMPGEAPAPTADTVLPAEPAEPGRRAPEHRDDVLRTAHDQDELDKRLENLRRKSRAILDETGSNALCVALGELRWLSPGRPEALRAPLILIPATLDREFHAPTSRYRFTLRWSEEEVESNESLREMLKRDFALALPEFGADDGPQSPEQYFSAAGEVVRATPGWSVARTCSVGLFSYSTIHMFRDLDPSRWPANEGLAERPLVREFFEGAARDETDAAQTAAAIDNLDADPVCESVPLVLEADSSQHSAIAEVARGRSLVIEGPPGTGKSQTITNLLAWALHEGLSVLFVAEKQAALEVVRRNLEKIGLAAFCLDMHDIGARPAEVYKSLGERLSRRDAMPPDHEPIHAALRAERDRLGAFARAAGAVAGPRGEPAVEAIWRACELRTRSASGAARPLDLGAHAAVDGAILDARLRDLGEIARLGRDVGPVAAHTWRGFACPGYTEAQQPAVNAVLRQIEEALRELASVAEGIEHDSGRVWPAHTANEARDTREARTLLEPDEPPVQEVLRASADPDDRRAIEQLIAQLRAWSSDRDAAAAFTTADSSGSTNLAAQIEEALGGVEGWVPDNLPLSDLPRFESQLQDAAEAATELLRTMTALRRRLGVDARTLSDAVRCAAVLNGLAVLARAGSAGQHQRLFTWQTRDAAAQARHDSEALVRLREEAARTLSIDRVPPSADLAGLADVLRDHADNPLRVLSGRYRAAMGEVRPMLARKGIRPGEAAAALRTLRDFRAGADEFARRALYAESLGPLFRGVETEWNLVDQVLGAATTLRESGWDRPRCVAAIEGGALDAPECDVGALNGLIDRLRRAWTPAMACTPLRQAGERGFGDHAEPEWIDRQAAACAALIDRVRTLTQRLRGEAGSTLGAALEWARAVRTEAELRNAIEQSEPARRALGESFAGVATDGARLARSLEWCDRVRANPDLAAIAPWLCERETGERCARALHVLLAQQAARERLETTVQGLGAHGTCDRAWLLGGLQGEADARAALAHVRTLTERVAHLGPWAEWCRGLNRLQDSGLGEIAERLRRGELEPGQAPEAYECAVYETAAARALAADPALGAFTRHGMDESRARYAALDRQWMESCRRVVAARACGRAVPRGVETGRVGDLTELSLIENEVKKQKRHLRLRPLMQRAGRAVAALKPCVMMSPQTVARYLAPGAMEFDLVVMDEASQVRPEAAVGALARARRAVIVGDSKQLPPTSFYQRVLDDGEEPADDATIADDSESVLEVAARAFRRSVRLTWHYRSRHESLIAFSNERFYDGELVVFPSPTRESGRLGVSLQRVAGACRAGVNRTEAEAVVEAIVAHARETPSVSIGVGAFNAPQRDLIESLLDARCARSAPDREAVEALRRHRDPLFIKNLESLQGDERDVIVISYTYGPEAAGANAAERGRVMQRFGPITQETGWRRLNVLVTRARRRVIVYSSMDPGDIDATGKSRGVQAMRQYLEYAASGGAALRAEADAGEAKGAFERVVSREVERLGYRVGARVGVAGFRMALGVLRPGGEGEYLLGIECDGPGYLSARSTRDRDRLRDQVIEGRGWALHRVWSVDWFRNPLAEAQRLRARLAEVAG